MIEDLFSELKRYAGFSDEDARMLHKSWPSFKGGIPAVIDAFYGRLSSHDGTRQVLEEEPGRVDRLRLSLRRWLEELFSGVYDDGYYARRCQIGRVHVRVGLPQHYMFTAMSVVRQEFARLAAQAGLPDERRTMVALNKLLDIELAIMNETYREDYVGQVQSAQRLHFEQRLSASEHLATIGQLAASLAHEIKNPLAGISGAIQVLRTELGDDHSQREMMDEALRQIDRLDAAVRDLLLYARPQQPATKREDLNRILAHSMILLRQEPAFRSVRVRVAEMEKQVWVRVDEAQMKQVIMNLLINAAHACEVDGEIECAASRFGDAVRLIVRDSGCGIESSTLSRVFEPFFTTKARGTGLGLAICQRIVESHEGRIGIESAPGQGTVVTIELPAA